MVLFRKVHQGDESQADSHSKARHGKRDILFVPQDLIRLCTMHLDDKQRAGVGAVGGDFSSLHKVFLYIFDFVAIFVSTGQVLSQQLLVDQWRAFVVLLKETLVFLRLCAGDEASRYQVVDLKLRGWAVNANFIVKHRSLKTLSLGKGQ